MSQFEIADSAAKAGTDSAAKAKQSLSNQAFEPGSVKDAGKNVGTGVAEAITGSITQTGKDSAAAEAAGKVGHDAKEGANKVGSMAKEAARAADGISNHIEKGGQAWGDRIESWPPFNRKFEVTDKDRAEAKDMLGKQLSDLIPEKDREILKTMQASLIDGNLDGMKKALGSLADDPAKMDKFIKELNSELSKSGANVELAKDSQGNVLIYDRYGNTAVSINPKTGDTTLRAVERQGDGSVVLKPGEIINRQAGDVMKSIGDNATREMTEPRYYKPYDLRPVPDYNYKLEKMDKFNNIENGAKQLGDALKKKLEN